MAHGRARRTAPGGHDRASEPDALVSEPDASQDWRDAAAPRTLAHPGPVDGFVAAAPAACAHRDPLLASSHSAMNWSAPSGAGTPGCRPSATSMMESMDPG